MSDIDQNKQIIQNFILIRRGRSDAATSILNDLGYDAEIICGG